MTDRIPTPVSIVTLSDNEEDQTHFPPPTPPPPPPSPVLQPVPHIGLPPFNGTQTISQMLAAPFISGIQQMNRLWNILGLAEDHVPPPEPLPPPPPLPPHHVQAPLQPVVVVPLVTPRIVLNIPPPVVQTQQPVQRQRPTRRRRHRMTEFERRDRSVAVLMEAPQIWTRSAQRALEAQRRRERAHK